MYSKQRVDKEVHSEDHKINQELVKEKEVLVVFLWAVLTECPFSGHY
tara:strand:+ start:601 stop:741 length:141 start_codon:yes stop_codon:yes gene_type:complete